MKTISALEDFCSNLKLSVGISFREDVKKVE